jgi:hypothetical protein
MNSENSSNLLRSSSLEHTDFRNMLCRMLEVFPAFWQTLQMSFSQLTMGRGLAACIDLAVGGEWWTEPLLK